MSGGLGEAVIFPINRISPHFNRSNNTKYYPKCGPIIYNINMISFFKQFSCYFAIIHLYPNKKLLFNQQSIIVEVVLTVIVFFLSQKWQLRHNLRISQHCQGFEVIFSDTNRISPMLT